MKVINEKVRPMNSVTPSYAGSSPLPLFLASPSSYYDKRDHAIAQSERVKKIQEVAPKGAKSYIKERQKSLQNLHKVIKNER